MGQTTFSGPVISLNGFINRGPDFVVNIGDLLDFHAMNMHDHDPDLASPGDEMTIAREYVKELECMFPKVVEVESNHSSMVFRRALKSGMSRQFLKPYVELDTFVPKPQNTDTKETPVQATETEDLPF